jgi:hypothetical protein
MALAKVCGRENFPVGPLRVTIIEGEADVANGLRDPRSGFGPILSLLADTHASAEECHH